ncbi:MAG TPA: cupin domain-containing protein [Cyclobacteriaceae bacterium]|nr:cupin domain-containing protein [Cyclobacteriaceae bacterium]
MKAIFKLCCLVFALNLPLQAQQKYTIENCVNEFDKSKIDSTTAGYQYWFADKKFLADSRTLKLSVVDVGKATHAPHQHPEDEFFFILEGKAEFFLDGKTKVVGPYTSLYCPSNVMHGIKNAGDTQLKYLVIKKYEQPKPEK